jgi:hypothetical protein
MAKLHHRRGRRGAALPGVPGERTPAKRRKLAAWQGAVTSLVAVCVFFGLLEGTLDLVGVEPVLRSEDPFVGFVSNVPLFVEERTYGELRDIPAVIKSTSALLARTRTWAAMSSVLNRRDASPPSLGTMLCV